MTHTHYQHYIAIIITGLLVGCSDPDRQADSKGADHYLINQPCKTKPNCVSTLDNRAEHLLTPFQLSEQGIANWPLIQNVALQLPGAKLASTQPDYFRIECTSSFFRFVDDFEVKREGDSLTVRSESRVGYSDFGVNRQRAEAFRQQLSDAGYLKTNLNN
ncbi:DUF1499 domain-containing protein [Photobacterium nomapromontoriensis]|uniref:DUF1499 domain-containing protein n=1 Tax=Photobacterium nomapromontoriensis TaxID=2910237 RepID=UPI003D0976B5